MVSVIVVSRNEENHIGNCILSVIKQFESDDVWELLIIDGMSSDNTVEVARNICRDHNLSVQIIINTAVTLANGWNIGIQNSKGNYIIRPDAHAELGPGYIRKAKKFLDENPDTGIVGGKLVTKSGNKTGFIISEALSMKCGVGNSSFRTAESSGYKDTAVYGLYRRSVFETCGLFNIGLNRHQDTEFHKRVLNNNIKIFFLNTIYAIYYCRDSVAGIARQMYDIGYNFSTLIEIKAGDSMRIRHWIPFIFYALLFLLFITGLNYQPSMILFLFFILIYLSVILTESVFKLISGKNVWSLAVIFVIPVMHISYAYGTFRGLFRLILLGLK